MKIRPVVVWLREPGQVRVVPHAEGVKTLQRTDKLEFEAEDVPTGPASTGWFVFRTAKGEAILIHQERIAWVEVGAETERPT